MTGDYARVCLLDLLSLNALQLHNEAPLRPTQALSMNPALLELLTSTLDSDEDAHNNLRWHHRHLFHSCDHQEAAVCMAPRPLALLAPWFP